MIPPRGGSPCRFSSTSPTIRSTRPRDRCMGLLRDPGVSPHPTQRQKGFSSVGCCVRRREAERDDVDLTPMVDMTFALLIFFMITASFSVQMLLAFPRPCDERKGAMPTVQRIRLAAPSSD